MRTDMEHVWNTRIDTPQQLCDVVASYNEAYDKFVNEYNDMFDAARGEAESEVERIRRLVTRWYVSQKALYDGLGSLEMAKNNNGLSYFVRLGSEAAFDACEEHIAVLAYSYLALFALQTDGLTLN